MMYNNCQY